MLDERQRMAGEIHDILAQGLTGIVTQLEAADQAAGRPADWRRHLDQAKQLARDSLTEARRSVQALRPQPLADGRPAGRARRRGRRLVHDERRDRRADHHRHGPAAAAGDRDDAAADRAGGAGQRGPARRRRPGRPDPVLHGGSGDPGRPRRRRRLRPGRAARRASEDGGFGLAAMRERVHRIAGTLEIESEPGGGTAISACVPAISLRGAAGMIRLLIVDDHPVVRDGLRGMFAGDDRFQVVGEAGDGHEALAVARSVRPDVVLMDLRMPGMDGVTTIRRAAGAGLGGPGAGADHLRHRQRRAARDRGRRHRLPAQGHPARGAVPGGVGGRTAASRCCPRRSPAG